MARMTEQKHAEEELAVMQAQESELHQAELAAVGCASPSCMAASPCPAWLTPIWPLSRLMPWSPPLGPQPSPARAPHRPPHVTAGDFGLSCAGTAVLQATVIADFRLVVDFLSALLLKLLEIDEDVLAQELEHISCLGVYDRFNSNGATILHCAAEAGDLKGVKATLRMPRLDRSYTVDVDATSGNGSTAVVAACANGHISVVRALLSAGKADVKLARDDGCTPALVAARHGHAHVLRALVAAGADMSLAARGGVTPICMAVAEVERWKLRKASEREDSKALKDRTVMATELAIAEGGGGDGGGGGLELAAPVDEMMALVQRRRAAKEGLKRAHHTAESLVWLGGVVEKSRQVAFTLFSEIDDDNSGRLSTKEIGLLLKKLWGERPTKAQLEAVMAEADKDNSGEVDFEEFYSWWWADRQRRARAAALEVFREMDDDGSGVLDRREVGKLLAKLSDGKRSSADELDKVMAIIDQDGSGEVDFEEFYDWWWAEREQRLAAAAAAATADAEEGVDRAGTAGSAASRAGGRGAEGVIKATQEQLLFLDRAVDRLRHAERFPNTVAALERFRLGLIARQQRAERADAAWRAEQDAREQRDQARARMKLADEQFWGALLKQAQKIWAAPAAVQLQELLHRAVHGMMISTEVAESLREEVSRGRVRARDAYIELLSQWRGYCGTEAGSPKVPANWDDIMDRVASSPTSSPAANTLAIGKKWLAKSAAAAKPDYWYSPPKLPPVVAKSDRKQRRQAAAAETGQYRGLDLLDAAEASGTRVPPDWDRKGAEGVLQQLDTLDTRWCHASPSPPRNPVETVAEARRRAKLLVEDPVSRRKRREKSSSGERTPEQRVRWHTRAPLDGRKDGTPVHRHTRGKQRAARKTPAVAQRGGGGWRSPEGGGGG